MIIRHEKAKTLSTLLAGLGVGLFPTLSFGLGLGDIQIESRLNQRLHARIEVVDVSDEEWQQIRARIAPRTLLSEASVHPEILDSLNLRAIEDTNHRHFIEVTSTDALTEPLFDLPVAVSGPSLQVVRNYSVLLDPASVEDASPGSTASMLAQHAAPAATPVRADAPAHVDAPKRATRHHHSRVAQRHSSSSHLVAAATNKPDVAAKGALAAQPAAIQAAATQDTPPAKGAEQQLEGQLATLQQMLTQMQATIAAQDAEIAKLTAQVAARPESQVSRKVPVLQVEAASSNETEVSDEAASPARTRGFRSTHPLVYRLAGIVGGMVVLVLGAVALIRRRHLVSLREIHPREPAKKDTPAAAEPTSDVLAWQSSLREAQSGTWRSPMKSAGSVAHDAAAIHVEETYVDSESSSEQATVPPASVDPQITTVATTVAIEDLTANLEANLEALSASYETEHLQTSTGVLDEWRAQKEMLERDYLSDTEALPFVLDEGNRTKSVATTENPALAVKAGDDEPTEEQPIPAQRGAGEDPVVADISSARSAKNGEVAEILDLLNKLAAAQEHLSPAQLLHLETLRRSLREGKPDTNSDFVADIAM
jgi:hypothetical protein